MSVPLMTPEWVKIITDFVNSRPDAISMLECGSGESTTFFASMDNLERLVSIEADSGWYSSVKNNINSLEDNIKSKIQYELVDLDQDTLKECSKKHITGWNEYEEYWKPYSEILDKFPDESFDLILIDGHDRKRNFLKAMTKLKKTGWIIMHDMLPGEFDDDYEPKEQKIKDFSGFSMVFDYYRHGKGRGNLGFALEKK